MTQGLAVTILLSVGPLIHRTLNDGVMDILEPRCQPTVSYTHLTLPTN